MSQTKNALGSPVVGDDFIGRVLELDQAFHLLVLGNHLRIPAPRRVGKTSFTKALIALTKKKGWKTVFVNVEETTTEIGFVKALLDAFEEEKSWIEQKFNGFVNGAKKALSELEMKIPMGDDLPEVTFKWNSPQTANLKEKLSELLKNLGDSLIVIDELPWLLARIEKLPDGQNRVAEFLHWLRSFRQNKEKAQEPFTRWIFCGSISFEAVTERLNLTNTINDTEPFELGAYPRHEAEECLVALNQNPENRFVISAELRAAVIDYLQWPLPYFLQLLYAKLRAIEQEERRPAVVADLQKAIELAAENSNLNTWVERLNEQYLPENERLAKVILDQLCQSESRTRSQIERLLIKNKVEIEDAKDKTAYLIKSLMRDGYLMNHAGNYAFRSPLLKKYWYKQRIL